jgi:hypothetical protein
MNHDSHINREIALRKFHELGLADGDLGMLTGMKSDSYSNERPLCKRK